MKNLPFIIILLFVATTVVSFTVLYPSGSPGGYTNSPADGHTCTVCHGGSVENVNNYISTNIPIDGYIAGNVYDITINYSASGKKGFEITCEDASNAKIGQFISGTGSKLVSSGEALTHSHTNNNNPSVWTFSWTAPVSGTGAVTFYSALSLGDSQVKLCSMPIDEDVSSATENLIETSWSMYPNPCQSNLNIQSQNNHTKTLQIYALNGQLLQYYEMTKEIKIDLEDLQAGVYMVLIQEDKHVFSRKLFKQ